MQIQVDYRLNDGLAEAPPHVLDIEEQPEWNVLEQLIDGVTDDLAGVAKQVGASITITRKA